MKAVQQFTKSYNKTSDLTLNNIQIKSLKRTAESQKHT